MLLNLEGRHSCDSCDGVDISLSNGCIRAAPDQGALVEQDRLPPDSHPWAGAGRGARGAAAVRLEDSLSTASWDRLHNATMAVGQLTAMRGGRAIQISVVRLKARAQSTLMR